jgi:hypothetical protein
VESSHEHWTNKRGQITFAVAIQKITDEYWKDYFRWPIMLIIIGMIFMYVSSLVSRWLVLYRHKIKKKSEEVPIPSKR